MKRNSDITFSRTWRVTRRFTKLLYLSKNMFRKATKIEAGTNEVRKAVTRPSRHTSKPSHVQAVLFLRIFAHESFRLAQQTLEGRTVNCNDFTFLNCFDSSFARGPAEQGKFAEESSRFVSRDFCSVDLHRELSRGDNVHGMALLTLAEDNVTGLVVHVLHRICQASSIFAGDLLEEFNLLQQSVCFGAARLH